MPVTCNAGHGCSITCPGNSCWAIYWHDTGHCDTGCCDEAVESIRSRLLVRGTAEDKVNLACQGMPLPKLAVVLDTLLPDQIAIPAAKVSMQDEVSVELKEVSLSEVIKSLGLVSLQPTQQSQRG